MKSLIANKFQGKSPTIKIALESDCLNERPKSSELELKFEFDYKITTKTNSREKEHIFDENEQMTIEHKFEIEGGPSPTDRQIPFFVYIPKSLNPSRKNIKVLPKHAVTNCTNLAGRIFKDGDPNVACGSDSCEKFRCELKRGFGMGANKKAIVSVSWKFIPSVSIQNNGSKFWINTALKIDDNAKFVMARTSFVGQKFDIGGLMDYWYVGVGMFIALFIFIAFVYIMYKKNVFNKLRFAKNAMEKEEEKPKPPEGTEEEQSKFIS